MHCDGFRRWLAQAAKLTAQQRSEAAHLLAQAAAVANGADVVNQRAADVSACPHCYSERLSRWGKEAGLQRYRCGACRKTFNATTGTPLAGLKRRDAWLAYAQAMVDGLSVRKAAQSAGIDRTTSFRWRHRLLQLPTQENDTELVNIVEADETYFLESFKGQRHLPRKARQRGGVGATRGTGKDQIPVLVVQDRQGGHFDAVLPRVDKATLGCLLPQLLAPESVLCTDGAGVYRSVAKTQAIAHEVLNQSAGVRVKQRVFHIQHVNAYDSRLKGWMVRFRGVATKYLPHYLGWRRLLEHCGKSLDAPTVLLHAMG